MTVCESIKSRARGRSRGQFVGISRNLYDYVSISGVFRLNVSPFLENKCKHLQITNASRRQIIWAFVLNLTSTGRIIPIVVASSRAGARGESRAAEKQVTRSLPRGAGMR